MYFWCIRDVTRVLATRGLTEAEAFRYFFANWLLLSVFVWIPEWQWNVWDLVVAVGSGIVTVLGTLYCYAANGGGAGREFLQRFFAIIWVVSIRTFVLTIAIALPVVIIAGLLGVLQDETAWWDAVMLVGLESLIYVRTAAHMKRVAALARLAGR